LVFEDAWIMAEDGVRLHGWWFPDSRARGTVLYFHGNGENAGDLTDIAAELVRENVQVLLLDYRGYGHSGGLPTERGTYRDARAAYEFIRAQYGDMDAPPVLLMGRSLGGAVAIQLALDRPVRGLVIESTFSSTAAMARMLYPGIPMGGLLRFRYENTGKIGNVRAPVLLAHSRADEIVPFAQGRELFARAPEPKWFFELQGGHNEHPLISDAGYRDAFRAFLDRVFGPAIPRG
jgi:fermentation-respiration switch protein FrsA (DUF1100 family)